MKQRDVFFNELLKYALKDKTIVLLYADIGGAFLDAWNEEAPDRTINVGPAENAMITCAAGLAQADMKPYCFSIIPFLIFRPYEAIRIYLGHQRLPVRLVGVGADDSYAEAGFTHWSGDDFKLTGLPTKDLAHASEQDVRDAAIGSVSWQEPLYIRLLR